MAASSLLQCDPLSSLSLSSTNCQLTHKHQSPTTRLASLKPPEARKNFALLGIHFSIVESVLLSCLPRELHLQSLICFIFVTDARN